jgi:hypothetical protein
LIGSVPPSVMFFFLQINKEYLKNLESLCLVCNYVSAPKEQANKTYPNYEVPIPFLSGRIWYFQEEYHDNLSL